jgi:hypothetical protein
MERAQLGFLNARGTSQQLIGRRQVVSGSSVFRGLEHASCIPQFRHRISASSCYQR